MCKINTYSIELLSLYKDCKEKIFIKNTVVLSFFGNFKTEIIFFTNLRVLSN